MLVSFVDYSCVCVCVVDSKPGMEETILVGDDLMMGPPSPVIPPEIASHVLEGVDLCDGILRNLFLCNVFVPRLCLYIYSGGVMVVIMDLL